MSNPNGLFDAKLIFYFQAAYYFKVSNDNNILHAIIALNYHS